MRFPVLMFAAAVTALSPVSASAFCGFYVGGAGASLFADATQVVLMREGTQTVLSMQNRYSGPADDFAMVIPVPVVLQEADVKTLHDDLFAQLDTLTSPRLVEYWETDPCKPAYSDGCEDGWCNNFADSPSINNATNNSLPAVIVEAEFAVGEYNIVVLSAQDSTSLDTWLDQNDYNVPAGAAPYYQPYINSGMYFFVAKVDSTKVTFDSNGNAQLSPLRFSYTSAEFSLPVRLGMINSQGQQDLIIHTLGARQRYELANYTNVTIPTNIRVDDSVRNNFGDFYRALFAKTLKENPGAAITEYAWDVRTCDPCPAGDVTLSSDDLASLGGDVLWGVDNIPYNVVATRIHLRYDKDEVGEDLVFRTAEPIVGGREFVVDRETGELEKGAKPGSMDNFQARYIIRHQWDGPVACDEPVFGRWGGPNGATNPGVFSAPGPNTTGEDVFATISSELAELVREDIPEIGVIAQNPSSPNTPSSGTKAEGGGCTAASPSGVLPGFFFLGVLGLILRRRR